VHLVLATLIIVGASALAIVGILAVRRRAPDGGYFTNGDRAAGVFGVLATGFALLLGFVVFLAFTKYDDSRAGSEAEALVLVQQFETAQLMPAEARARLSGELICYGRSVVEVEWPAMRSGDPTAHINPWAVALFRTLQTVQPQAASEQSAYDAWLDQTSTREAARRDRLHAAEGIVPLSVWVVLFFSTALIMLYVLFFADSGEPAIAQALMAGTITAGIVATLLVLVALDRPYRAEIGRLEPVAMQRSLQILDEARDALALDDALPCDDSGRPE
jgi:Protein of unknown function (DUF4239)